jgi:hypothetical protein
MPFSDRGSQSGRDADRMADGCGNTAIGFLRRTGNAVAFVVCCPHPGATCFNVVTYTDPAVSAAVQGGGLVTR